VVSTFEGKWQVNDRQPLYACSWIVIHRRWISEPQDIAYAGI
jgi:hypothetical protein